MARISSRLVWACAVAVAVAGMMGGGTAWGQLPSSTNPEGFGLKIFKVESGLYPFVQVYFRTFDQAMQPLVNLNYANIGVMVKGKSYDPQKRQYAIQSIRARSEAVRTVIILDCSKTMAGKPFDEARKAAARFIDSKRKQDQVAILAIRDTKEGYELVSNFERDGAALGRRLADVKCDGNQTHLYDSIAAAMQMCGMVSQGGISTTDAEYIISNSIVVFSDGKDEGSALSREELNSRISSLQIPVPIYSLAYSKVSREFFKNLEALSKNSFGVYFSIGESMEQMQKCVENVQNILQSDYVVTFRSYVPVDGGKHAIKVGVEYPSGSGKMTYQSGEFEAIEPPPVKQVQDQLQKLNAAVPALPDGNPFLVLAPALGAVAPAAPAAAAAAPGAAAAALEGTKKP